MADTVARLRKLRRAGRDELRVRGTQAFAALLERAGARAAPPRTTPGATEALERFRGRQALLTPAFDDLAATSAVLHERFPDSEGTLAARADRIVAGRFDLLGYRELAFGDPIDWHVDPVSGRAWPPVHWSRLTRGDARTEGDRKVVWELNRHQLFVVLGRAYGQTGDERYAAAFARALRAWMDRNPPGVGINWASSLELAFRVVSWTWALHLFRFSTALTPDVFDRAMQHLRLHGRHIRRYLSTYSSPTTHLTGEALGLAYLGTAWPELPEADAWYAAGSDILDRSAETQIEVDGVYFERSTAYHLYTTHFYVHLALLARTRGEARDPAARERLAGLLDHLLAVARPDGTMPLLGDDDGGQLLPLDERPYADIRSTLAVGAVLLERPDYKAIAGAPSEELLWLLGPDGVAAYDRLEASAPNATSRAFPAGGLFVLRDGWSEAASVLVVGCGDHGGAHAHADALSFDLCVRGAPLLVDPGTFTYVRGDGLGDRFRSTAAHNTVVVDGVSSGVPAGPFSWSRVPVCTLHAWTTEDAYDFFEGSHDGYERLADPVTHVRAVLQLKDRFWVVRDRLVGSGAHRIDLCFHFAPEARPLLDGPSIVEPRLRVTTFGAAGTWALSTGWVSPRYGARAPAPVATLSTHMDGPLELVTFLVPDAASVVRELVATGGVAYEVDTGRESDVVLLRHDDAVEWNGIRSECEWACVRPSGDLLELNGGWTST